MHDCISKYPVILQHWDFIFARLVQFRHRALLAMCSGGRTIGFIQITQTNFPSDFIWHRPYCSFCICSMTTLCQPENLNRYHIMPMLINLFYKPMQKGACWLCVAWCACIPFEQTRSMGTHVFSLRGRNLSRPENLFTSTSQKVDILNRSRKFAPVRIRSPLTN